MGVRRFTITELSFSVDGKTWTTVADGVLTTTTGIVAGLTNGTWRPLPGRAINIVGVGKTSPVKRTVEPES